MPTPAPRPQARSLRSQHGSIAVYLALALVAFGVLAMAGVTRFSSVVSSVLAPNCATSARYMAESGMRYAMARLRAADDTAAVTAAAAAMTAHGAYIVDAAKGLSFTLNVTYDSSAKTATVASTGKSCANITASTTAQSATVNLPKIKDIIDFSNLEDDFFRPTDLKGSGAISVDSTARTISFGKLDEGGNAAAIWYSGNATTGCLNGNCTMTNGFNSYFDVQWNSASVADGLVFGIMSGETNTVNALGGATSMGELMGWGGPGTTGYGLRSPKIGVELDTYYNSCSNTLTSPGSRCDPNPRTSQDHLAYVYWGATNTLYDDNRHGAGSGNTAQPVSSNDPDNDGNGLFGTYYPGTANWLRGGTKYFMRHELTRLTTASSASSNAPNRTYCYMLKTWIVPATVANPSPSATMKDVTTDYDAGANPPTMQQVIFLNETNHNRLAKIIFGWTEATGQDKQNITVGNFNLAFKKAQPTYGTAPSGASVYWPMYNNIGSSVTDASGNDRTGTINGTVRWVPGIANNNGAALYFDGATTMTAADNAALDLNSPGGVALWFKPYAANTGSWLLRKGLVNIAKAVNFSGTTTSTTTTETEGYGLYTNSSGELTFRVRYGTAAGSYVEATSTTKPAQGSWYHVAATWNGTALTLYVNGVAEKTVSLTLAAQDSADLFYLGGFPTITRTTTTNWWGGTSTSTSTTFTYFTGIIDEVYLYKKALTQTDITALATGKP